MKEIKVTWKNEGRLVVEIAGFVPADLGHANVEQEGAVWSGILTDGFEPQSVDPEESDEDSMDETEPDQPARRRGRPRKGD